MLSDSRLVTSHHHAISTCWSSMIARKAAEASRMIISGVYRQSLPRSSLCSEEVSCVFLNSSYRNLLLGGSVTENTTHDCYVAILLLERSLHLHKSRKSAFHLVSQRSILLPTLQSSVLFYWRIVLRFVGSMFMMLLRDFLTPSSFPPPMRTLPPAQPTRLVRIGQLSALDHWS